MFCPKCGKDEQSPNAYCRACGEWLTDVNSIKRGGAAQMSPEKSLRLILTFSVLCAVFALATALVLIITFGGGRGTMIPPIAFAMVFSFIILAWQIVIIVVVAHLLLRLKRHRAETPQSRNQIAEPNVQGNYLPAADTSQFVRPAASVTENTTDFLEPARRPISGDL